MSWKSIKEAARSGETIIVSHNDYHSMMSSMAAANETLLFDFVTTRDLLQIGLVGRLFGEQVWLKKGADIWFRHYLICA